MGEVELAAALCAFLAGSETEEQLYFDANGKQRYVRVDCTTQHHVVEIGLDGKASTRDSVHQALFYAELTGKKPVVIVIDQDGVEDRYEYEIRVVARNAGVLFATCGKEFIQRWAATSAYRIVGNEKSLDDLPENAAVRVHCDLPF